jgi:hypothetical protein
MHIAFWISLQNKQFSIRSVTQFEAACVEYQNWPIDVMHVKFRP